MELEIIAVRRPDFLYVIHVMPTEFRRWSGVARKYKAGPDVKPDEEVYDSKGNRIDPDYIDRAVEDVHRRLGPGRPSLTAPGAVSPEIKARVPADLKRRVEELAKRQGKSASAVLREALEEHLEAS